MPRKKDSVDLEELKKFAYDEYYRLINKLKETQPHGSYNSLKISRYYTNYRLSEYAWQYNKHHICEIDVSGAGIMDTEYRNSECIIVDQEQHCLLHYLIVLSGRTRPNHGMLLQFGGDVKQWEEKVVSGCKKYNVKFVKDWTKFLTIYDRL